MTIRGCLLGGAVGDALGAPVEFDSIERIRERFGPQGVTGYEPAYGRRGAITDDTQMTVFTAEGLIRAQVADGRGDPVAAVDHAYARWLATQGVESRRWDPAAFDGWLLGVRALHSLRAPGNTCLSALRVDVAGSVESPLNDSKGCGTVMRIAPVGLLGQTFGRDRFDLSCDVAALTHGHPSGYLAAGALAQILGALVHGRACPEQALDSAERRLLERPHHEETLTALAAARDLARSDAAPGPEVIATLGAGWVAEEALAIGVYCALVADSFEHGVLLAVNHSGDSDSTGAITGNLLGAMGGSEAIPARWLDELELRDVIETLCRDLVDGADLGDRYPPW